MTVVDAAVGDREILRVDHSRDGLDMRLIVASEDGREEFLAFRCSAGEWRLVARGAALADHADAYGAFKRF